MNTKQTQSQQPQQPQQPQQGGGLPSKKEGKKSGGGRDNLPPRKK